MAFFDSFFGKSQARDISAAHDRSLGLVNTGYDRAERYATQGRDEALGYINPYIKSGQQASQVYNNALGLGDTAGYNQAQSLYNQFSAPEQEATRNALSNQYRQYNRSSGGYSGGAALASARVAADRYGQSRNNWLGLINGQQQQGFQASQAGAGLSSDYGNRMGDYATGRAGTLASNEINYGNALAASRGTGVNNLLKIGEVGGKIAAAAMASDRRVKRDIIRIGSMPSGLPVYSFKYIWGDEPHIGVMAQEAAELFPDAVLRHEAGFLMVDYSRIA